MLTAASRIWPRLCSGKGQQSQSIIREPWATQSRLETGEGGRKPYLHLRLRRIPRRLPSPPPTRSLQQGWGQRALYLGHVEGLRVFLIEHQHPRQELGQLLLQLLTGHQEAHWSQGLHHSQPELKDGDRAAQRESRAHLYDPRLQSMPLQLSGETRTSKTDQECP